MMGTMKREMFEEQDKARLKKVTKTALSGEILRLQGLLNIYANLEERFGYCHPDLQVARIKKSDAMKIMSREDRERTQQVLLDLAETVSQVSHPKNQTHPEN